MSTVMWDLDGVACEFTEPFYARMCEWEGLTPTPWLTWHHHHTHGISDERFVLRLEQYAEEGGFAAQAPVPGFTEAVNQIAAAGHSQHVVTARPAIAAADTEWWVDTYAPQIETISLGRDKTVFKRFGPPTYYGIDDRIENVEAMRKASIYAYLLTRPWNVDSEMPRVATVQHFADLVTDSRTAQSY